MKGGDLLFADYKFGAERTSSRVVFPSTAEAISDFSIVSCLFCLLTGTDACMLYSYVQTGVVNVVFAGLIALLMTQLSFHIYARTWRYSWDNSYPHIVNDAFGKGGVIISILIVISYTYLTTYFVDSAVSMIMNLLAVFSINDTPNGNYTWIAYYIVCLVVSIFVCIPGKFIAVRHLYLFSNICTLLSIVPQIVYMIQGIQTNGFDPQGVVKWVSKDYWSTVDTLNSWSLIFFAHPFVYHFASYSKNPTQGNIIKLTWIANIINTIYILVGWYTCYLCFYDAYTDENVLDFLPAKNWLTLCGDICCILNLVISNTGYVRLNALEICSFFGKAADSTFTRVISGMITSALTIGILQVGGVNISMFIGSITFILIAFVIPPFLYLKMFGFCGTWQIYSLILFILGLAYLGLTTYRNVVIYFLS